MFNGYLNLRKKCVFFSIICNNNIFCAEKIFTEEDFKEDVKLEPKDLQYKNSEGIDCQLKILQIQNTVLKQMIQFICVHL